MSAVAAPLVPAIALAEATTDASHKRTRADAGSNDDDNDDDEEDDDVPASELDDASVVDLADVSTDRVEDFAEEKDPQFLVCKAALALCRTGQAQITACGEAKTGNIRQTRWDR